RLNYPRSLSLSGWKNPASERGGVAFSPPKPWGAVVRPGRIALKTPPQERPPIAVAMEAVSRITAIALTMVLPGILGQWLDKRWGTSFLTLLGFALGLSVAVWQLVQMSKAKQDRRGVDAKDRDSAE